MRDEHPIYGEPVRQFSRDGIALWETLYPANLRIPLHTHDEHAYFNLVLGGGYFESSRNNMTRCGQCTLAFHPPGAAHSNEFFSTETRLFHIRIDVSAFDRIGGIPHRPDQTRYFTQGSPQVTTLYREFAGTNSISNLAIEEVLAQVLTDAGNSTLVRSRNLPTWLLRVKELLHDQFNQNLNLAEIAADADVHKGHLGRVFRQQYGCTIGEYVRFLRVERACRDLSTTPAPLSRIAHDCGFSDQAHFSRTLKQFTGLTPLEYRRAFFD